MKVENAVATEGRKTIEEVGMSLKFEDNAIHLNGERIKQEWKPTLKRVKTTLQTGTKQMRIETHQFQDHLKRFFREEEVECHLLLTQNLHPKKMSSII